MHLVTIASDRTLMIYFRHALYNLYLCDLDLIENAALEDGTVRGLEHLYSLLLVLRKEILLFID